MKTRNILRSLLILTAPVLFSACNESLTASKAARNVPVSFRIVGEGTLDSTELMQIRSYVGDAANRIRLDSLVRRWQDKQVALQVPLGQPLEFRFDGINRRNDRLVSFWSAVGFDTLRGGDRSANVVALQFTRNDVTPPSSTLLSAPSGYQLLPKNDTLLVSLPAGQSTGQLSLPATLDSVYLAGTVLAKDSAGGWTLPVTHGQNLSLTAVSPNGTSATWRLAVRSGDIKGPTFVLSMTNGVKPVVNGDTASFALPYVIDSELVLTIANADPKDRLGSLELDTEALDASMSSWTIPVTIPAAGAPAGIRHVLAGKDSLGNATSQVVKVTRALSAKVPRLEWLVPPARVSWGARTVTFKLKVSGGDSMLVPEIHTRGLNNPQAPIVDTSYGDATVWTISLNLLEKDSGAIWVKASNLSGSSWSLDSVSLKRFDPLGPDQIPPVFTVVSPANAAWTRSVATSLAGRAWDERKGRVTVVVERGGKLDTAAWQASDSSWNWTLTWNGDGDSVVRIRATDSVGNRTKDTIWTLRRDSRKPSLAWAGMSLHGDTLWTRDNLLPLQAIFKDTLNGMLRSLGVVRSGRNDTSFAKASGTGNLWRDTLMIEGLQGVTAWNLTGTDSAGNRIELDFHVLRDTIPPVIAMTSGKSVSGTAGISTIVSASVSDDNLDSVTIDGFAVSAPHSRELTLPAAGASHAVILRARDLLGNVAMDTVVLTGNVRAPRQTSGVAPGATGREFLFDAACPDAGAILQDSAAGWDTWSGSVLIANTATKTLRCQANGKTSEIARFAWTPKDSLFALPPGLTGIPDSAYAMASDTSGTLWIVSTYGFAWYRPKGDSAWHSVTSPVSSNEAINVVGGTTPDRSTWFLTQSGTTLKIIHTQGTELVSGSSPMALSAIPNGRVHAWAGTNSFAIGVVLNDGSPALEIGSIHNLAVRSVYRFAGGTAAQATGIVETSPDAYTTYGFIDDQTAISFGIYYGFVQLSPMNQPMSQRLPLAGAVRSASKLADGSIALGVGYQYFNSSSMSVRTLGRLYRLESGVVTDSLETDGIPEHLGTAKDSRLWLGQTRTTTDAVGIANTGSWSLSSEVVSPATALYSGVHKLCVSPSGSAWYILEVNGQPAKLYRFFAR